MRVVLISTYELGRQPFGLASPAAWLRARTEVACFDLVARGSARGGGARADLVAFYVPMHTATRLAVAILTRCAGSIRARIFVFTDFTRR